MVKLCPSFYNTGPTLANMKTMLWQLIGLCVTKCLVICH